MCTAFNGQGDELEAVSDNAVSEVFRAIAMVFAFVLSSCSGELVKENLDVRISAPSEKFTPRNPVQVQAVFDDTGMPGAAFTFMPPDDKAFGEFTTRHLGEAIEFYVCGELLTTAVFEEATLNGGLLMSGTIVQRKIAGYLADGCR